MMTFSECEAFGKSKLENNTYLERLDDDSFGVRLHRTVVVVVRRNGTFTLRTGGFKSVTTKDRINGYSPVKVFQKKRKWLVMAEDGTEYPFKEGMTVNAEGVPLPKDALGAALLTAASSGDELAKMAFADWKIEQLASRWQ